MQPDRLKRIRESMLRWYDRAKRELPWRSTQDPYGIWVAEVMLQQTRVDTVIPYYRRFLERFPDVDHLARAPLEEVLETWAGIGYYGRARSLHSAAREVVERYGGELPRDPAALQRLPGIGRYTAGAIASIAFNQSTPILDGNAARVLSRLTAHQGNTARLWEAAAEIVPSDRPGDFNQALMDLGATVCQPRRPDCLVCPLVRLCEARRHGLEESLPKPRKRGKPRAARSAVALCMRNGRILMVRRPPHGLLAGMWDFPAFDLGDDDEARAVAARGVRVELGLECDAGAPLAEVKHVFTHIRLVCLPFRFIVRGGRARTERYPEIRWLPPGKIGDLATSKLARRLLDAFLDAQRG